MYLSFLSLSPLQIRTRTRSSYTTNSGMIRNFAFYMVRNSGRQLPRNKIIWLDARIIFKLNRLQSAFIITLIVMTNKKQLNKKLNNQLVKKWDITPLFSRTKTGYEKKSHAKNKKKQNIDPTPCIDPTPKHRSHLQPQKILWYGLLCHCPPCLLDHWEMRKDKMQSESTCFKNYKNGQKKKGSKKLTSPWQKGRKRCVSHFFKWWRRGKEKRSNKYKPAIYFFVC